MTEIPALADLLVVIALLLPGFVALKIFKWFAAIETKISDFDFTIWSLLLSLIIYLPNGVVFQVDSFDKLRTATFQPPFLALSVIFALVGGALAGGILKGTLRKHIVAGTPWDLFAKEFQDENTKNNVTVYTRTGDEYVGWVKYMGLGSEDRAEIVLGGPMLVKRDKSMKPTTYEIGSEILFTEEDIARVLRG